MAKRAPRSWRLFLSDGKNVIFVTRKSFQSTMADTTAKENNYKPYLVRLAQL
jgi:hypothetical protein